MRQRYIAPDTGKFCRLRNPMNIHIFTYTAQALHAYNFHSDWIYVHRLTYDLILSRINLVIATMCTQAFSSYKRSIQMVYLHVVPLLIHNRTHSEILTDHKTNFNSITNFDSAYWIICSIINWFFARSFVIVHARSHTSPLYNILQLHRIIQIAICIGRRRPVVESV